jgi:hypothetical protein
MFSVHEWPWELIICLLNVLKCNFVDVDEAVFHDDEGPIERNFYIFGIKKAI